MLTSTLCSHTAENWTPDINPPFQPTIFPCGEYVCNTTTWFHLQCPRCGYMIQMTQQGFIHSPRNCPHCDHPITTKDVNDALRPAPNGEWPGTQNLQTKINIVWPQPYGGEDTDLADGLYRVTKGKIRKLE